MIWKTKGVVVDKLKRTTENSDSAKTEKNRNTKKGETSENTEVSKEEIITAISNIYRQDKTYILLSTQQADFIKGISRPFVCQIPENGQKGIITFSREEYARKYIEEKSFEILDGVYPIGCIDTNDKVRGLNAIISVAYALGVDFIDYNPGFKDNSFGCGIKWFLSENQILPEISILMSKDKMEQITIGKQDIPLNFNPIEIYKYDFKYSLVQEESRAILKKVFDCKTSQDAVLIFFKETLFECCHTADYICTSMIPMAKEQNKKEDIDFFESILHIIQNVIVQKLRQESRLYTLWNPETNEIVVKNGIAYILYTNRFQYMGNYHYRELPEDQFMQWLKEQSGADRAMVTDGPHGMALIQL